MTIRDRGIIKWQPALIMPEQTAMMRALRNELEQCEKPIIDEHERAEFDERIGYAMEYNLPVVFSVWQAGFITEQVGRVHYVDPITQQMRIETLIGEFERLMLADVVGVGVVFDYVAED